MSIARKSAKVRPPAVMPRGDVAHLQAVLDSVADAVIIIDRDGGIQRWNEGAERIFGYRGDEMIGAPISVLMPENLRDQSGKFIQTLMETGAGGVFGTGREFSALRKDGSIFPIDLTIKGGSDEDGMFFTGIVRDITQRKQAEAELVAARQQAEDANLAKSQFLATMSHEIRTPMNGVLGMAKLLAQTPLNGRQGRLVDNLLRSGHALLGIINDILDFSKMEAGRLDLAEIDFDLHEVIAGVTDLFGDRCAAKRLEFVYFIAEDVPAYLHGDPERLRQILVNLVGNAIKFSEHGEILLEVKMASRETGHATLAFHVQDTGIGIAPEQRAQIFDSFHQLDGSMTRSRGGSGLGLAITKKLVEMMGGEIGVESQVGRGSSFRFTTRFALTAGSAGFERATRHVARPLRVLLIDTNAVSSHIMQLYLTSWKLEVEGASTITEARRLWDEKKAPFDVVIVDMKGLRDHGTPMVRDFQAAAPATKFILLTGVGKSLADHGIDDLAYANLGKPARPSELFNCLSAIAAGAADHGVEPFFLRKNGRARKMKFDARVLVVEDNGVNQEVAQGVLENFGCSVVIEPNGSAAVQRYAKQEFDIILMDCEMPVMNGFEATRTIRDMERVANEKAPGSRKRMPIVALTAHALGEVRDRCKQAGMDDFVVKPFDAVQLGDALKRWLDPNGEGAHGAAFVEDDGAQSAPPPAAASAQAVDLAVIGEIRKLGGPAGEVLVTRVVGQFLASAPRLSAAIHDSLEAGDGEAGWRAAHTLKSSAATLGALQLSSRCLELEHLAREHRVDEAKKQLRSFDAELAAALAQLAPLGPLRSAS